MPSWERFLSLVFATALLSACSLWAFILAADPYDTGRLSLFGDRRLATVPIRMATASLGRKKQFNAVIIGNSHVAPISPDRLSEATGLEFVSLTLAGASVSPEMKALEWFLRHRTTPAKLVVIGVDDVWCRAVPRYEEEPPLPLWLLSESFVHYAVRMFRYESLEHAILRFAAPDKTSVRPPHPRGFWDLELDYRWDAAKVAEQLARPWVSSINLTGDYPALASLSDALKGAPENTPIALIMLPVWSGILPKNGSEMVSEEACKAAFRSFARSRPNGIFIDARKPTRLTQNPENFFDRTHYRAPIAIEIEAELTASWNRIRNTRSAL